MLGNQPVQNEPSEEAPGPAWLSRFSLRTLHWASLRQGRRRQLLADSALFLVTIVWGSTFVMVKDAVSAYPVFSFLALRFGLAALVLAPFALRPQRSVGRGGKKSVIVPSLLVGGALFAGHGLQTAGLRFTTAAKAGFITGLSVVIVPLVAALILHQKPGRWAWVGVASATLGLALLSLESNLAVNPGDLLVLGCALAFASHILLIGQFAASSDPLRLAFGQIAIAAVLSALVAVLFEPRVALTGQVIFAFAFTGLFATAMAFGIQTTAQQFTTSTHTALILAAEPVFAAVFSFLLVGEVIGPRQLLGCALILAGMLAAEIRNGHGAS